MLGYDFNDFIPFLLQVGRQLWIFPFCATEYELIINGQSISLSALYTIKREKNVKTHMLFYFIVCVEFSHRHWK